MTGPPLPEGCSISEGMVVFVNTGDVLRVLEPAGEGFDVTGTVKSRGKNSSYRHS